MRYLLILFLLIATSAEAGVRLSNKITIISLDDYHIASYKQGIVIEQVFTDFQINEMQRAIKSNNYVFVMKKTQYLRDRLRRYSNASSALREIDNELAKIFYLTSMAQQLNEPIHGVLENRVRELQKIVKQFLEAKEASQRALGHDRIAQLKEEADQVRRNAKQSVSGASIFIGSQIFP